MNTPARGIPPRSSYDAPGRRGEFVTVVHIGPNGKLALIFVPFLVFVAVIGTIVSVATWTSLSTHATRLLTGASLIAGVTAAWFVAWVIASVLFRRALIRKLRREHHLNVHASPLLIDIEIEMPPHPPEIFSRTKTVGVVRSSASYTPLFSRMYHIRIPH